MAAKFDFRKYTKKGNGHVQSCEKHQSNGDSVPALSQCACRHRIAVPGFGFEKQLVVPNQDGTIAHAQLTFGNGVIVADADMLYSRAKAAGAEIVMDIKDEDYGGRGVSCRDVEDRLWNFGTYDPWETPQK